MKKTLIFFCVMTEEKGVSIISTKMEVLTRLHKQIRAMIDGRPVVSLYFNVRCLDNTKTSLSEFCMNCLHRRIEIDFDNGTLLWIHLLDHETSSKSLAKCFEIDILKNRTSSSDTITINLIVEEWDAEEIDENEIKPLLLNVALYEELVENNTPFYLFSVMEGDTLLGCYVVEEQISTAYIEESTDRYYEAYEAMEDSMRSFIDKSRLSMSIATKEIEQRVQETLEWFTNRYRERNQLFLIEEQSIPYTWRQLFVPTSREATTTILLNFMVGRVPSALHRRDKQCYTLACQERRANDTHLLAQCRAKPSMVVNLDEYEYIVAQGRKNEVLEVAFIKNMNNHVVCVAIMDRCGYAKLQTTIKMLDRGDEECKEVDNGDRIRTLAMQKDIGTRTEEMTRSALHTMSERIEYDNSKIQIDEDLTHFIARRIDQMTDREYGLAGSVSLFNGFFEHSTNKTNDTLKRRLEQGVTQDDGHNIRLSRGTLKLEDFDTKAKKTHMPFIREILADNENRVQIQRHQEQNLSVNTMNVMLGNNALSRTVIPCVLKNAYNRDVSYVMNVYGNVTINNTLTWNETNEKYRRALESLVETDDRETRKAIIEEALDTNKRKRNTKPSKPKRLILTERQYKDHKTTEEDELPYVVIKRQRVDSPDLAQRRQCDACEKTLALSAFYKRSNKTKGGGSIYHYLTNVCNRCIGH